MPKIKIGKHLLDTDAIVRGDYADQSFRKSFKPSQMIAVLRVLEPEFRAAARQRMLAGREVDPSEAGQAREKIARLLGTSRPTLRKIEELIEAVEANPNNPVLRRIVDLMDEDGKVDSAHRQMRVALGGSA